MKRTIVLIVLSTLLLFGVAYLVGDTHALDAPHDTSHDTNKVNCSHCHYPYGTTPAWLTQPVTEDNTALNNLCKSCHIPSYGMSDPKYENVQTHSSYKTSAKYGTWVMECVTCHNPHYQRQVSAYRGEGYIETGTSTAITTTTLTDTTKTWAVDAYVNQALIPNSTFPTLSYRIMSNTDNTITVQGSMLVPDYANTGDAYGIRYANMVNDNISTPASGPTVVKFFDNTGANSFADGEPNVAGVDTVVDGVCQVCHTQTHSYKADGTIETAGHPSGQVGTNCTACHIHTDGFKAIGGCDLCHGYPPVDLATLVFNPSSGTGSVTAGEHNKHVNTESIGCDACHVNSTGSGATHNKGDLNITLGFSLFSGTYLGGSYDGQTTANYNSSEVNTTVISPGTGVKTCSNLYCHSIVQTAAGGALTGVAGEYKNAVWDNAASVVCGSCHKGDGRDGTAVPPGDGSIMDSGKHTKHVTAPYSKPCGECHSGFGSGSAQHLNNDINMALIADPFATTGSYSQSPNTPGGGFGQCSNVYCHSIVQTNGGGSLTPGTSHYKTPLWSGAVSCGQCHSVPPATGRHTIHADAGNYGFDCWVCHNNAGINFGTGVPTALHTNKLIEMSFDPAYGSTAAYSQSPNPPGNNYGTCSTTYCHSQGTGGTLNTGETRGIEANVSPLWSGTTTCGSCHGEGGASGQPSYPNNSPKANSHPVHPTDCSICHNTTTTTGDTITNFANHVDRLYDLQAKTGYAFTYAYQVTGGTCSTISCHGDNNATWGGPAIASCSGCHGHPTTDRDNFASDGVLALIALTEWNDRGHGLPAAQSYPDPSGTLNPGADFVAKAGTGQDACLWCHDKTPEHDITSANPYRLRNNNALNNGWNDACLYCHDTDQTTPDYKPVPTFTTAINLANVVKIDKWHYGAKHAPGRAGGNFCWDCHDPHGDTANQIMMVQRYPTKNNTDATNGVPTGAGDIDRTQEIVFTDNTIGAGANGFARNAAPFSAGICNACHTTTDQYTTTSGAGIHATTVCRECHHHSADTTNDGNAFKGLGECIICHDTGGEGTTGPNSRRAIVPEFGAAWSHKRITSGAVTNNDCGVCHMEAISAANPSTHPTLHQNGTIELRDPDTGTTIKNVTFSDVTNSYSSTAVDAAISLFTRDLDNNALESHVTAVQINLCLKCHDADGALSDSAWVPGGSATDPFGSGASIVNIDSHFNAANASYHPITGKQNNNFVNADTMLAPWGFDKSAGTPSNLVKGYLISCWDCHSNTGATGVVTGSVTAHGGPATIRGSIYVEGGLCTLCHANDYTVGAPGQSAFGGLPDGDAKHNHRNQGFACQFCHSSSYTDPGRPVRAEDAHGFDKLTTGTDWTWTGSDNPAFTVGGTSRPYAFMRNTQAWFGWVPRYEDGVENPNNEWGCVHKNPSAPIDCNRPGDHSSTTNTNYEPGGAY